MADCNNSRVFIDQWRKLCERYNRTPCEKCEAYNECPQAVPTANLIDIVQRFADSLPINENENPTISSYELSKILISHDAWTKRLDCGEKADLHGANLRGLQLTHVNLTGADLSGADLSYAVMDSAVLDRANLSGAIMYKTSLYRSSLVGSNMNDADMRGADMQYSNISKAGMFRTDLRRAILRYVNATDTDMKDADLSEAIIDNMTITMNNGFTSADFDDNHIKYMIRIILDICSKSKNISDDMRFIMKGTEKSLKGMGVL